MTYKVIHNALVNKVQTRLPQKCKAPLLKTFWRRFCLNLGDSDRLLIKVFLALIDS